MRLLTLIILLFFSWITIAQESISLVDCINKALNSNQLFASNQIALKKSEVNQRYDKLLFLPTLNFGTGINMNNGRKLDPFTNTFGANTIWSNNYGLNSQLYLFQGGRYFLQRKIDQITLGKNEVELAQAKEKVKQQVIERYLSIWKNEIQTEQQNKVISDLKRLFELQTVLVEAGKLSSADTLQTVINLKTQQINLASLKNNRLYDVMQLNFLMGQSISKDFEIVKEQSDSLNFKQDSEFQIEVLNYQLSLLEKQYQLNKTQFLPSLSLSGFMNTGFSTNNKDYSLENQPVFAYDSQLKNNQYQGVGVNVSIPIFNKGEFFRQQKLNQLSLEEQQGLLAYKKLELERIKLEISQRIANLEQTISLNNAILSDKKAIYKLNFLLYKEGKIRLNDLEKIQSDYYDFELKLKSLELDLYQLKLLS